MKWEITLVKDEDVWITATCAFFPGCISQGKTKRETIRNMKKAIEY